MNGGKPRLIESLDRIAVSTSDLPRLIDFYQRAFDCALLSSDRLVGREFEQLMQVSGGARRAVLAFGTQTVEIVSFDQPGKSYPTPLLPNDPQFQHFAIVVNDMDRAFQRLSALQGWLPISAAGPQRLPPQSGSVKAFKFQDPDGHPLELLEFPNTVGALRWQGVSKDQLFLGIDHCAISVRDVRASIAFYEELGLRKSASSLNRGHEQQLLDGVSTPIVDVVALDPPDLTPHVELLHYRTLPAGPQASLSANDIPATRLIFRASRHSIFGRQALPRVMRDPDGHWLELR